MPGSGNDKKVYCRYCEAFAPWRPCSDSRTWKWRSMCRLLPPMPEMLCNILDHFVCIVKPGNPEQKSFWRYHLGDKQEWCSVVPSEITFQIISPELRETSSLRVWFSTMCKQKKSDHRISTPRRVEKRAELDSLLKKNMDRTQQTHTNLVFETRFIIFMQTLNPNTGSLLAVYSSSRV